MKTDWNIFDALGMDFDPAELGRMQARVAAGIPSTAAGPWDDALRITTDAEHVADLYRRLAARDTP